MEVFTYMFDLPKIIRDQLKDNRIIQGFALTYVQSCFD